MAINFKNPKNTALLVWTQHCLQKMRYYGLSETKIRNVLYKPKRKEEGVAPNTIAQMHASGTKKRPTEIWIMYQKLKTGKVKMISAWRYPGITKPRQAVPISQDILTELKKMFGADS